LSKPHATLKDVATAAGVSYQTVSKVLNKQAQVTKETEERIWAAVRKLGYRPNHTARSLRTHRAFTIGYSWPPTPPDQANPILDQFLQSMLLAAEKQGYYLLSFPYHTDLDNRLATYIDLMDTGRVDGFVISSVEYDDPRAELLLKKNFPFVGFGRSNPELKFPWLDVDGAKGIELAVNHLVSLGHRRIAALAWPETSRVGNNRLEGYAKALQAAGIPLQSGLIKRGEGRFAFGTQATHSLLDLAPELRPTAVVALNDPMAIGAIAAAKDRGLKVGPDFAITGFDDAPMVQYLEPPLTTIRQPIWDVGQRIIPLLLDYIASGQPPEPAGILLEPQLIERGSTTGQKAIIE
jgi:DNA-binding LacI/PurR family transcriptional regulator